MNFLTRWLHGIFNNSESIKSILEEAKTFEANNEFEDACYSYACAVDQGEGDESLKEKIRNLYSVHGPFKFEKQLQRMKQGYCSRCESCGEGFHIGIVRLIGNIIEAE